MLGRTGRGQNPPPQLGHTLSNTDSTQLLQKVHSKLQIIASFELGGKLLLQCSHVGLSCNIYDSWLTVLRYRSGPDIQVGCSRQIPVHGPKPEFDYGPRFCRFLMARVGCENYPIEFRLNITTRIGSLFRLLCTASIALNCTIEAVTEILPAFDAFHIR